MDINANWINKKLAEVYGVDDLKRPNFRVSWSDDQREHRKCRPKIYLGDIFIRQQESEEVQEMLKYPFIRHRYVLERLMYHSNPELIENPSYEPIHVFDKAGELLPLDWEMISYACHYIMTGQKKTKQAHEEEAAKADKDLSESVRAELKNDRPYLPTMIENGEAVSLPKTDYWVETEAEEAEIWEKSNVDRSECRRDDCEHVAVESKVGETNT